MSRRPTSSILITVPLVLAVAGTLAHIGWVSTGQDPGLKALFDWIYDLAIAMAGITCLARAAVVRELRGAWIAFGLGLLAWALGDIYWTQVLSDLKAREMPYPSMADAGYLTTLPCFFVGIALLIKHRVGRFTVASWFDGAIGALAAAALATAVLAPALVGLTKGDPAAVMTNLAYPLGDLLLIAFITGAVVIGGVRGASSLLLVGMGLLVWTGADIAYLYQVASGTYEAGLLDSVWPLGALLFAVGARASTSFRPHRNVGYRSSLVLPALFTLTAAAMLVWDHFDRLHTVSIWLAGATIAAVVVRLAVSLRENDRLMMILHGDSVTDPLTGLANRRQLLEDLKHLLERGEISSTTVFALFDLDGFKAYNDSFGHPAGDVLLKRLGASLTHAVGSRGTAYRLGGDEFCILIEADTQKPLSLVEMGRAALAERGEGFSIVASVGWLVLPDDAESAADALNQVDQRMYAEKNGRSSRSTRQTQEVLMRVFREREPSLSTHVDGVARLALDVGKRLSLDEEELDVLGRAAELHDLGKIAIPDEILQKRQPLDAAEWALMHRHTLIGYRILDTTPAMRPVARLVRSSHERWDAAGYPDSLGGEEIPLGSRIIFVCDSFDAMTTDRPYRAAISKDEAVAELRRQAGTQFDPEIVELFCEILDSDEPRVIANGRPVATARETSTNGRPVATARDASTNGRPIATARASR